jgi:NAD(P)-dependent dehydrogenase (short-subunit alcohol dehydrogenase family)
MRDRPPTLDGRVVVVTGASSGIGEVTARALADAGASVVAVARRRERLELVAGTTDRIEAYEADVTSDEDMDALAAHVGRTYGACHVLVNNAGIPDGLAVLRSAEHRDAVTRVMDVNFMGAVRAMTAFFELLVASAPSQVVNVASVAGKVGVDGSPGYTASKFALVGLTEAVAEDWRRHGIAVTQLNPGYIRTEGFPQDNLVRSPLTRRLVGTPEMVADAILDVIRSRARERTVPRWYRSIVVSRHVAAPAFRLAARGLR